MERIVTLAATIIQVQSRFPIRAAGIAVATLTRTSAGLGPHSTR